MRRGGGGGTAKSEGTGEAPMSDDEVGVCSLHVGTACGALIPENRDAASSADIGEAP
jgi:hypothetical protein